MNLADPRRLGDALRRHRVRPARSLGQRFLVDPAVLRAILDAAELTESDDVLEVGPGPGVLTAALAERAASVTAVEVDRRMVDLLNETLAGRANVRVVEADALRVDLYALGPRRPTRVVANLPYQITTPLLERFLADPRRAPIVVVLVQREVARRMRAAPSDRRERGYLSVFVQSFAEPELMLRVPPRAFRPAPRVESALVRLRVRGRPLFAPLAQEPFLKLVSDAFRHRRKQLRSALGHEAGLDRRRAEEVLRSAGVAPERRPEELSLEEWIALARASGVPSA